MCGIGGILLQSGSAIPDAWIESIDSRIAHRGPDGCGVFRDRVETESGITEVALIHRRLSIIDIEGGEQPMVSEQGRDESEGMLAVVFNGCIYNHRDLRKQLIASGHHFATDHSDTEVLLHGYREWGQQLEDHLEGMYAFAIWDRDNGRLTLARDTFGEKPLHVRFGLGDHAGDIAFCSDARALSRLGPTAIQPDWSGTYLQLGYNHNGQTAHQSIVNTPPSIVTDRDTIVPAKPRDQLTIEQLESLLDDAVAQRLEADVPLGCFLSGGVDSSLIAHFAKLHKPDIQTFTVRMPDSPGPSYDESTHAEQVASYLETNHTTIDIAPNPAEDLVHLVRTLGQPFGDSSILPTYWVSRAAREHVKVSLAGDGADELFFGYDRYMHARSLHRHRRILKWLPRKLGSTAHPKSRLHKLGRLGNMARDYPHIGILAMESLFTQEQIAALLGRPAATRAACHVQRDPMLELRNCDLGNYLPGDLLTKVDTASMAVALEVRCPFLDPRIVHAALNAPTWILCPKGRRKGLLRDLASRLLPDAIINRPKMGFAIPISDWFRTDHGGMQTLLLDHLHSADPFGPIPIKPEPVNQLIEEHLAGVEHGQRLFAFLTLSIWARESAA